ncbi:MAG: glycosyltransferase family 4 protein [Candidatus Omnitrophica bacterium]|nr:glycosyltransferase family 4 protein [Candidatus Omnitrophota bacterium]
MRIGIDAHILGKGKGGVEVYLKSVLKKLPSLDARNDYSVYLNNGVAPQSLGIQNKNFCLKGLMFSSPWLRRSMSLPLAAMRDKLDVLHVQRVLPLFFPAEKSVVSIYDIAQEIHPEFFDAKDSLIVRQLIKSSAERARRIITCSYTSKADMVAYYHIPPERIIVAYPAVENFDEPQGNDDEAGIFLKEKNIRGPFLLFVGAVEPRKNLHGVIDIMNSLKKRSLFSGQVVILGGFREGIKKDYYPMLKTKVKDLGLEDDVVFLGYEPESVKKMLMKKAVALLYPSFYEGFGIPILEAMAAGIPVVVSRIPVFSEIVLESGLYADPHDCEDFANQVDRLLRDKSLFAHLVEKGKERVQQFHWVEAAKKHLQAYEAC